MPIFGSASPFDADVDRATDELNVEDNWSLILDICDRAKHSSTASKDCLRSIRRRLRNRVPYVALQALTLLNACVKNCGHVFHLEIASREFVDECCSILSDKQTHVKVAQQLKSMIKSWSENEFRSDSSLSLIPSLYSLLKSEGHSFASESTPKSKPVAVASSEEEDFVKAIALSLKEADKKSRSSADNGSHGSGSSLYPSISSTFQPSSSPQLQRSREPRKVRALYDFEAVEDNELTFKAGEVIGVLDDSDCNWWKGVSWRGEGLFPANFVTSDLNVEVGVEPVVDVHEDIDVSVPPPKIDEEKINLTLTMIENADPTADSSADMPDLTKFEDQCLAMGPLIDQELEKIDRVHGQLVEMNVQLMDSLKMYNSLMLELPQSQQQQVGYIQQPQYAAYPQPAAAAAVNVFAAPMHAANVNPVPLPAMNVQQQLSANAVVANSTVTSQPAVFTDGTSTGAMVYAGPNQLPNI